MKVKELQAKWLNGKFHCPPRDEWNGTFKTPSEINGAPISQIKNFITGQTDTGHQCRNRGCGLPTARCYNQLGHMSWCQYWIEDIDSPCGARCRNEKGYCELHTKLRPADFEIAGQKNDASYKPTETATNFLQHADVKQLEGSLKQMAIGEQAAEDEAAGQEGKDQTWNEMRTHQNLQDRGILGLGSRLATGDDEQAVAGAEQPEVQEPPTLEPELVGHAGIDESKLGFRKKREPNDNPTKKMNKARKQAEKKLAQEEQSKKSHGKAFKRKKGRS